MLRPRELSSSLVMFPAKTPTLAPATHTNSYALGGRDVVLVEPATPYLEEQRAWIAWARGLESQGRRLVAIVATHHHPDHVGGAEALCSELGVPLWAHPETTSRITAPVARALDDGDAFELAGPRDERWEVLHTPGHAPGHVCLLERSSGTLIVGDMVASVGTILIAPGDGDMIAYLGQLERLAKIPATLALPAHGDPIDDPAGLFRRYIVHRTLREERVVAALPEGPVGKTTFELLPDAYADTPELLWPIAELSLRAHLEKLVREGRAVHDGAVYRKA